MSVFVLLSWLGNIGVAVVMGVPCSFILVVLFMIASRCVLMRSWLRFSIFTGKISEVVIDDMGLLNNVDWHIMNGGKPLFDGFSLCASSPVRFNTLHMPLVDNSDNILRGSVVKVTENTLISLVYQNCLLFGSCFTEHSYCKICS